MNKIKPSKLRSAYGPKKRVAIKFIEPTLTKQSMQNECDINQIMAKYQKTGAITHLQNNRANYGFADSITFHECLNIVTKAQSMFAELPSSIRKRFDQDPARFLDFVQNPENSDELVSMGLANAPTLAPPTEASSADEAPTPPPAE